MRRKYSFKFLINRKILECRQSFTMANSMASSGLSENAHLPKLILTINGTIGNAERGTWCQDVRHQIGDVAGPIPSSLIVDAADTVCGPPALLMGWCCWPCTAGLVDLGGRAYLRWRSGVLNKTSSHV